MLVKNLNKYLFFLVLFSSFVTATIDVSFDVDGNYDSVSLSQGEEFDINVNLDFDSDCDGWLIPLGEYELEIDTENSSHVFFSNLQLEDAPNQNEETFSSESIVFSASYSGLDDINSISEVIAIIESEISDDAVGDILISVSDYEFLSIDEFDYSDMIANCGDIVINDLLVSVAACDDADNDGVCDDDDNCPSDSNADQTDTDGDGEGDECDADDDNDSVLDDVDSAPLDPNACSDDDDDSCEDCSSGTYDVNNDGVDDDEDGYCSVGDCDDTNATLTSNSTQYLDSDIDTYGDLSSLISACGLQAGYVLDNTDCDDTNASINPGASEILDDGIDQDCDGSDETSVVDCAGVPGGDSWESDCGCVAVDNSGDDCDGCDGIANSGLEDDECGVCDGGGPSIECGDSSFECYEADCPAELTGDLAEPYGSVDSADAIAFTSYYKDGNELADLNEDGSVNWVDIKLFLGAYLGG